MIRKRPMWYYGILCLVAAALPQVLSPPKTPEEASNRLGAMLLFSALGLILIGVSAVQIWRRKRD